MMGKDERKQLSKLKAVKYQSLTNLSSNFLLSLSSRQVSEGKAIKLRKPKQTKPNAWLTLSP